MNTGHDPEAPPGFTSITPTRVELTGAAAAPEQRRTPRAVTGRAARLAGGALLLGALGALYLLLRPDAAPAPAAPIDIVQADRSPADRQLALNNTADLTPVTDDRQPSATLTGGAETPWELAQQAQLRRQSQTTLEQMLEAQKLLEERGVARWAGAEYQQALQHARAGDTEYSHRNFPGAQQHYAQALARFTGLLQGVEELFDSAMARGRQALYEGLAPAAEKAFGIALAIDPADRAALQGMQRAGTLDQVVDLIEQGDVHLQDGRLEQARDAYRQALELDGESRRAQQQLERVEGQVKGLAFRVAMSAGFKQLEQQRYEPARQAFAEALKLKPGAVDARSGLEQAEHKLQSEQLGRLLEQARALEDKEDWSAALDKYEAALGIDANLARALQGKARAALHQQTHQRLERLLANPQQLYDRATYTETIGFRDKIRQLKQPGPLLTRQLEQLDRLLEVADTPLPVQLQSNQQTLVTVRKVGEQGYFDSKRLLLRPGAYVAVGRRDGYRDVRVEFFVRPGQTPEPVVVSSAEKIALGR